jgi:hypothetical protein
MFTSAVTSEAPAVSLERDNDRHADFLPTDKHYRLTGEMPKEEPRSDPAATEPQNKDKKDDTQQDPAVKKDDSASSGESETAAASEAAQLQEKEKQAQQKTAKTSETRWQKLSRENKELRDRLTKLEQPRTTQRDTQQRPQPATEAAKTATTTTSKPKIDDVDPKTGKAKYASYAEYEDAKDQWLQDEAVRKFQESSSKTQREQALQNAKQTIAREFGKKVEAAKGKYADFETVALNPDLPIKEGSPVDVFTLDSEVGTDVLYYLGQNPAELDRINKLNPVAQVRELTKIELKVATKPAAAAAAAATSAKPTTQAPRPPHQVSGKAAVTKDAVEKAVEDGDSETYIREQNARELARRRGK